MKFTVNKDTFLSELTTADSIINPKSPLTILLNIYIEAQEDGGILLMSYNGDNGIKIESAGNVEEPGKICLYSRKLLEIVKTFSCSQIIFETDPENNYEIKVSPSENKNPVFTLRGLSAENYPTFKEIALDENYIRIAAETLLEQIQATEFSVSHDFSKLAFTGTYIEEVLDDTLTFVTTDGKKLSVITRECEEKVGEVPTKIIVPEKVFSSIKHTLKANEDVILSVQNNQIHFKIENTYIFSNLVEGKFPNYRDVIPSENTTSVTIDSTSLYKAINTVSVMCGESEKIHINVKDNFLRLSASNNEYGNSFQEVPAEIEGDEILIALNYRSLLDFLKVIGDKAILITLTTKSSPILIHSVHDEQFLFIIMPMKTDE